MTPVAASSQLSHVSERRAHPALPPVTERTGNTWEPISPCVPACLAEAQTLPRIGRVRVAARMTSLIAAVFGFALSALLVLPLLPTRSRDRLPKLIFQLVLRAIGVRLVVRGGDRFDAGAGTGGVLVVANHLSWLDILVLGAVQPTRMVAKQEVRDWPLLGSVAARVGTLFVDRSGLRSLPSVVSDAADALRGGAAVGLFPEGTTWCGTAFGPFRRAGFQAALDAGVAVRPVAQRMRLLDGTPTTVGAFIGEDTLCDSLLRVLRLPGLVVEVDILPLLVPDPGMDRRHLAASAQRAVAEATGVPMPEPTRRSRPGALPAVA